MVAAGSVVAAVQGLYVKSQDVSLSSQNLTNFLSQVIRSDPVTILRNLYSKNPKTNQKHLIDVKLLSCTLCMNFIFQDCLRACQEQIESLLESSLRQAQHCSTTTEPKCVDGDTDLSCTPTDVRDVNI